MHVPVVSPCSADVFHLVTTRAHYFHTANSHQFIGIQSTEGYFSLRNYTEHKYFEEWTIALALHDTKTKPSVHLMLKLCAPNLVQLGTALS